MSPKEDSNYTTIFGAVPRLLIAKSIRVHLPNALRAGACADVFVRRVQPGRTCRGRGTEWPCRRLQRPGPGSSR